MSVDALNSVQGFAFVFANILFYFICLTNGISKMFTENELCLLIEKSGLKIEHKHASVGIHAYKLMEFAIK